MEKHFEIQDKGPLAMYFHQWTKLFNESEDELFHGEKADTIKGSDANTNP